MDDGAERQGIHRREIATWAINTLGKAVAVSVLAAFVVTILAVVAKEPLLLFGAGLVGPLAFSVVLYNAEAPLPYPLEDVPAVHGEEQR